MAKVKDVKVVEIDTSELYELLKRQYNMPHTSTVEIMFDSDESITGVRIVSDQSKEFTPLKPLTRSDISP